MTDSRLQKLEQILPTLSIINLLQFLVFYYYHLCIYIYMETYLREKEIVTHGVQVVHEAGALHHQHPQVLRHPRPAPPISLQLKLKL